jgi:hypothetical protein
MLRALNLVLGDVAARTDIRCLILHGGKARAFCAGSDIKEFEHLRHDASEHKILFEDMVLRRLAQMPMPTVPTQCATPVRWSSPRVGVLRFVELPALLMPRPEVVVGERIGIGCDRLRVERARLVGPSRAKELLFTGETIPAEQALVWGLVNRVVDDGTALDGARQLAATIIARGPLSNRLAKKLVDAAHDMPLDAGLSMSTVAQQEIFESTIFEGGRICEAGPVLGAMIMESQSTLKVRASGDGTAAADTMSFWKRIVGHGAVVVWNDVAQAVDAISSTRGTTSSTCRTS